MPRAYRMLSGNPPRQSSADCPYDQEYNHFPPNSPHTNAQLLAFRDEVPRLLPGSSVAARFVLLMVASHPASDAHKQ